MPRFVAHPYLRRRMVGKRMAEAKVMDASGGFAEVAEEHGKVAVDCEDVAGDSTIYIVGGVDGGGSLKYINDFKMCFPGTKHIRTATELRSTKFSVMDTLFLQHLYKSDLTHSMICDVVKATKCRLVINILDYYYFSLEYANAPHNNYLRTDINVPRIILELFSLAKHVLHPTNFTLNSFNKYFPSDNCLVSQYPDFKVLESSLNIPEIKRKTIHIGVLTECSEYKGKEYNSYLASTVTSYNGYRIEYFIVGKSLPAYKENEFFEIIKKNNIHGLLALNKWGETYGYAMSKYLKSGLPFLYNNIGAFKERVPETPHFIKAFNEEITTFTTEHRDLLQEKFKQLLDVIIGNEKPYDPLQMIDLSIEIPDIYKFLFKDDYYSKPLWSTIHKKIKPYAIYFPQFHQIIENDVNFYPGMTDMTSLCELIKSGNPDNLDTPNLKALGLTSLVEYDQSNNALVQRQIELAKRSGICGFCVYYYWFSKNTISKKNMIFEKCIDNFFTEELTDFKVFFNWANEDWSNNAAFTEEGSKMEISNDYTRESIVANFNNLLKYFKHPNYLKINNCPVFYIHHPWFMTEETLLGVKQLFNEMAVENGFDGIYFRASSMDKHYDGVDTFDFCPRYKKIVTRDYIESVGDSNSSSIFFSFNNSARMFKPAKTSITKITSSWKQQQKMLALCIANFIASEQPLFLINSWNEWGENMAIEPGENNGSHYIHLIRRQLAQFLNN